jgi:hypothetical protein
MRRGSVCKRNWVQTGCKNSPNFIDFLAPNHSLSPVECMAGTTGLEPATSAVTVLPFEVFQRLTSPWGTPKATQVV